VEAEFGSWDKKRLVGDVSGPLTQSGVLRGRFVAVADDSDSFVDYVYDNKKAFYGVLEIVPNTETKIGLGLQYQQNKYRAPLGGPVDPRDGHGDLGFNRSTFFADPHPNSEQESLSAFLDFEQKLPNDWLFKANYAHNRLERDDFGTSLFGNLNPETGDGFFAWRYRRAFKTEADTLDVHASGPVQILGRRHEIAFGINSVEHKSCSARADTGPDTPLNIYTYHPSDLPVYGKPDVDCGNMDRTRQHGAWGVARLNVADFLKLILGARVSWYDYRDRSGVQTMEENAEFSPYAGIVYDLNKQLSVYASYSDIFKPQSDLDRTGSVLKPVVGSNYEVGIKGEFFEKRLNAAAAIFRLEQTNLATQDVDFGYPNSVCSYYCYYASGKVITEGVDLSLNGALSPNWNINIGYTYANSEYATGVDKGERYETRNPKQIFRIASTYRIPGSHWTVGGNLRAQSNTYRTVVKQSGFALVGLMAKYQINTQAEVSITADNVFDRKYRYPNFVEDSLYGEPRSVFASVKYRF
jgi:outer membrane receptor for ferric coprogen and ferric-rhodotorulic acid